MIIRFPLNKLPSLFTGTIKKGITLFCKLYQLSNRTTHVFDYLKGPEDEYRKLLPMQPKDQQRFDEKMRLEFNCNSNHREGNTPTYFETKTLITQDIAPAGNKSYQELEEMAAHFGRNTGAIRSRIKKLELMDLYGY